MWLREEGKLGTDTEGDVLKGGATSLSLFATFQSAESIPVVCLRSPSEKLSIFFSTPVRIACAVSPTQQCAS